MKKWTIVTMHSMELFFDGASKGNPGLSGAGWAIYLDGKLLRTGKTFLGRKTNNQAEYLALSKALEDAIAVKDEHAKDTAVRLIIKGDSELIIRQLNGTYQVRNPRLKPLFKKVMEMLQAFDDWECLWVPREKNYLADSLANEAISEATTK